jgi:hypothetical protein
MLSRAKKPIAAKEDIPMLIRVRYCDNSYGMVDDSQLENLISTDRIMEFRRSSGWVRIGSDRIRSQRPERRRRGCIINTYV